MRRVSRRCPPGSRGARRWWPLLAPLLGGLVCLGPALWMSGTGEIRSLAAPAVQVEEPPAHQVFVPVVNRARPVKDPLPAGIQIFGTDPEILAPTLATDARWVRLPITWSAIEPANTTPEFYQWPAGLDAGLKSLADQGFQIILTLVGNPSWAASYAGGPIDKVDIGELVEFLRTAVARYSQAPYDVKYWELYNEPDNGSGLWASYGWGYFGNDPEAYADLLKAVYQPMKAANPAIQVLFGGISFDNWIDEGGPFVQDFLDQVLQNGAGPYFDVMNFHYYPNYHEKWSVYGIGLIGKTTFLRDKLASYGLDKPFMCTETGSQTSTTDPASYEEQTRYLIQTMNRGAAAKLQTVIWFMLSDQPGPEGYWKTGLLDETLAPKPSFYAYRTLTGQLGGTEYVRPLAPGEFGTDGIEGYVFYAPKTAAQIVAVWSDNLETRRLVVPVPHLTVVSRYGDETAVSDADDGTADGRVTLAVDGRPVYLRLGSSLPAAADAGVPAPQAGRKVSP